MQLSIFCPALPPPFSVPPQTKVLKALSYTPVVVLSTGEGKWNTGVWPGYGPKVSTLNWAAAGVVVNKTSCPYQCEFTDDQTKIVRVPLCELASFALGVW